MQQVQRLESCGLAHPFLLIEGEPRTASSCTVYDKPAGADDADGHGPSDHISNEEDIGDLCARLFVTHSSVGVITSKDAQGTSRVLGQLTAWLEWTMQQGPLGACGRCSQNLSSFELAAHSSAQAREDLVARILVAGIPTAAAECLRRRFSSVDDLRKAVMSCASPEHRLHFFDFHPSCAGMGERICAALGVAVPSQDQPPPTWTRSVHLSASSSMLKRLGMPAASPQVFLEEDPHLWINTIRGCCAEIVVRAHSEDQHVKSSSERIVLVVVPGAALLHEVLLAARRLGARAPSAAIADAAASAFAAHLPDNNCCGSPPQARGPHLVILEGVRAAILAEARRVDRDSADPVAGEAVQLAGGGLPELLPRLLGLVELAALALDLRAGWRTRVHDTRAAAATASFVRAVVRAALEEALLPHAV